MVYPRMGRVPLPPKGAQHYTTMCQFCNVGCGYDVYVWPAGAEGSPEPGGHGIEYKIVDEAYGRNLVKQPDFTKEHVGLSAEEGEPWISEAMVVKTIRRTWERGRGTGGWREVYVAQIPSPECPINWGNHSVRGGTQAERIWSPWNIAGERRLTKPLVRFGGRLEPVSWEYAIDLVARVVKGVIDKWGIERPGWGKEGHAVFAHRMDHGGGGGGGMIFNTVVGLFFFYGVRTAFARIHNRPFFGPENPAAGDAGPGAMNTSYHDLRLADTIILWGNNPYSTATVMFVKHVLDNLRGATKAEKQRWFNPGEPVIDSRIIIVDPRRTETVEAAEAAAGKDRVLHLQVKPGTDIVLANAIARVIYERYGDVVEEFVNHYRSAAGWGFNWDEEGFQKYVSEALQVGKKTLDEVLTEAESITGVPRDKIELAAKWIAERKEGGYPKRVWLMYEKGIIWNQNYRSIYSLFDLCMIAGATRGLPGCGCQRQGGHQEGFASPAPPPPPWTDERHHIAYPDKSLYDEYYNTKYPRADFYMPTTDFRLANGEGKVLWVIDMDNYRLAPNSQRLKAVVGDRAWRVTRYVFAEAYANVGGKESEPNYDPNALEPVITTPPSSREYAEKVLQALEETGGLFVIVEDIYPTFMVEDAHVVLPAAFNNGEWPDVRMGVHERRFRIADAWLDPPGEAKPDWWILANVAKRIVELYEEEGRGGDPVAERFRKAFKPIWDAMEANARDPTVEVENEIFKTYIANADEAYSRLGVHWEVQYWTPEFKKLDLNILRKLRTIGTVLPITKLDVKPDGTIEVRGVVNIMEPALNDTYREEVVVVKPDGTIVRRIEVVPSNETVRSYVPGHLKPWPAVWDKYPPYVDELIRKGYKYWVVNGRYNAIWQTGYADPNVVEIMARHPMNIVQVNPEDAAKEGLENGDIVVIYNDYGSTTAMVWVTRVVAPGTIFLIMAHPKAVGANAVTTPSVDPAAQNPDYKLTLANLRKIGRADETIIKKVTFKDIRFAVR
ncbi:probable arsenite oxidase large subunit [Aeropyrum pernix]|uniref:Probable arsenite oxidase large subunit n=1 Tax=Aeropyrum pernix TaxID=56636 RepID=A0A401HC07_AERPX|nr:arsenate reductase (azurin) large subunit [Aeropyrum pernix]GBF09971.1 probable arsenite oxidase large subunit [Aeropyrum pernix]